MKKDKLTAAINKNDGNILAGKTMNGMSRRHTIHRFGRRTRNPESKGRIGKNEETAGL